MGDIPGEWHLARGMEKELELETSGAPGGGVGEG